MTRRGSRSGWTDWRTDRGRARRAGTRIGGAGRDRMGRGRPGRSRASSSPGRRGRGGARVSVVSLCACGCVARRSERLCGSCGVRGGGVTRRVGESEGEMSRGDGVPRRDGRAGEMSPSLPRVEAAAAFRIPATSPSRSAGASRRVCARLCARLWWVCGNRRARDGG